MLLVAAVLEVMGWLLAAPLFYISCHLPPSHATMASRPNFLPSLPYPKPRVSGDERLRLHQKDESTDRFVTFHLV